MLNLTIKEIEGYLDLLELDYKRMDQRADSRIMSIDCSNTIKTIDDYHVLYTLFDMAKECLQRREDKEFDGEALTASYMLGSTRADQRIRELQKEIKIRDKAIDELTEHILCNNDCPASDNFCRGTNCVENIINWAREEIEKEISK